MRDLFKSGSVSQFLLHLPILQQPWDRMLQEFLSMKPNDSNQSVNAPLWLLLVQSSLHLFGDRLLAYRLPGVLLTALAPVFSAAIVRRFRRPDLAFLVGGPDGLSEAVKARYRERTGREKKVTSVQLGYESRCAPPYAFDVMLGSQLGIGAYRALVEEGLERVGHTVQKVLQFTPHRVAPQVCDLGVGGEPYFFCLVNVASARGILDAFRGTTYTTWTTARAGQG